MKLSLATAWPVKQASGWHYQDSVFSILTPVFGIPQLSTLDWTPAPRNVQWPAAVVKTFDPK